MTGIDFGKDARQKKKRIIHILSFITLIFAAAFITYGIRTGLFKSHDAMAAFIAPFGLAAPAVYILFIAFQSTFMVVPGAVGNLVGVLLFGPLWGIVCNYLGTIIGSSVNFFLARTYGPEVIRVITPEAVFNKYEKWLNKSEEKFQTLFAVCIFLPLAPDDVLCYLAGLTQMSFKKFIIILLLGKPLAVTIYSLLLHYGFQNLLIWSGW